MASDPQRTQLWQEDALGRHTPIEPFWARYSRGLWVTFAAALTRRDVTHTLGTKPDGFMVVWADACIRAVPGIVWTDTGASLQADRANAHALLLFYTLREEPERAQDIAPYTGPTGMVVTAFTPTLTGQTTAGSQTYTTQAGSYTKTDKLVTFQLRVQLASKGGTMAGAVVVGGPPFAASTVTADPSFTVSVYDAVTVPAGYTQLGAIAFGGATSPLQIFLTRQGSGVAVAFVDATHIANTTQFQIAGSYFTD